jgi:hypothetical protein
LPHSSRLLLVLSLFAVLLVLGGAAAYSYMSKGEAPSFASSGQDRGVLKDWSFIIMGDKGIDLQEFQRILRNNGINVTVVKYNGGSLDRNPANAHIVVIVNLIDRSVYSSIESPSMLNTLRNLSLRGGYVLFLSNNTKILKNIAGEFNPPLTIPGTSTITITKQYKNDTKETTTENLLIVIGRTYKSINGKMVPEDITITVHYKASSNLDSAIQKALNNIPGQITEIEFKPSNSNRR